MDETEQQFLVTFDCFDNGLSYPPLTREQLELNERNLVDHINYVSQRVCERACQIGLHNIFVMRASQFEFSPKLSAKFYVTGVAKVDQYRSEEIYRELTEGVEAVLKSSFLIID